MTPEGYLLQLRAATAELVRAQESAAALVRAMRLGEVLIHHVDLGIGYQPRDWPAWWVGDYLDRAVAGLAGHPGWPGAVCPQATDTGRLFWAGDLAPEPPVVADPEYALLAWLLGRSDGGGLARAGNRPLPEIPVPYAT